MVGPDSSYSLLDTTSAKQRCVLELVTGHDWGRYRRRPASGSEALPVHDGGARLVVLALGDPHLLEGTQGRQDGAADPHRVLALWRSHDFDLHGGRRQSCELLCHALADAREHGGASRQHDVRVQVLADVHIALHDALESGVVHATGLLADEARLEQHLRAAEALAADGDDVAVWQLVRLLLV